MKEILSNINLFYSTWLHPVYDSLMLTLVNNQYVIYILLAVVIGLSIIKKKIKVPILPGLIDLVNGVIIILLLIAAYSIFSPSISKFIKSIPSATPKPGATSTKNNSTEQNAPAQQKQAPAEPQSQKQLYYSVNCYNCWAEGCSRNGYNYGGYDAYYYSYYYALCKSCSCNDFKAVSFWK